MLKKRYLIFVLMLLSVLMLTGCKKDKFDEDMSDYLTGKHYVSLDIKDQGSITLELDADAAPRTVTNFVALVESGFYDGLTFHRIIPEFMIQGGDPLGNGSGSLEEKIVGEFAKNGFDNPISHTRGTISMARANDYDSASCQFFIVHKDSVGLDGSYAAFGKVIAGMNVVDTLALSTPIVDYESGTVEEENQPVIETARVITSYQAEQIVEEENRRPDPVATIVFNAVDSFDGLDVAAEWNISENGAQFLLSSTENLISIAIYSVDLSESTDYAGKKPLAYQPLLNANDLIAVSLLIEETEFPNLLLVAEEYNGALGKYLICNDETNGTYLVPVLE